jgi:hypothetical protein
MKNACIVACTLLFVSVAGFAQKPSPAPLTREALAAILGPSAVTGSCPLPQRTVLFAAKSPRAGLEKSLCSATANCASGTVTCTGNNSTTSCSAADRNCATGEQGHVTCDSVTTWCPTTCTSGCSPGPGMWCCQCDLTGSCLSCCRCEGGTLRGCAEACG